ncbi:MAG TPA: hypothetical protein VFC82_09635 [Actinomycetaceae bacterium]|nr:hypothetical protein [Actinomycetaceae bacterium]
MIDTRLWLVIKTGANQRFIFGSHKRRLNVGGSYLVTRLPAWVNKACGDRPEVEQVVNVSGIAQLLVPDVKTAREIIKSVTTQALNEAPGLEVWGWFEEEPDTTTSLADRLSAAMWRLEEVRANLVPVEVRNPGNPFVERCGVTRRPAAWPRQKVLKQFVAPVIHKQVAVAEKALRRIRDDIIGPELSDAVLPLEKLDEDVTEDGWVAVVHADGNGFGQLLMDLSSHYEDDYIDKLKGLSKALDVVAQRALQEAIAHVNEWWVTSRREEPSDDVAPRTGWILPLIVGGDDLTAIVDAGLARRFTEAYLHEFELATAGSQEISEIAEKVFHRGYLTACAGIAVVKPTHPFFDAYTLAEELCQSAKRVKNYQIPVSAYDMHIAHEAAGRSITAIRGFGWEASDYDPGPVVISVPDDGAPTAGTDTEVSAERVELDYRLATKLDKAIDALSGGFLTASQTHRVRTALTRPIDSAARKHEVDSIIASYRLSPDPEVAAAADGVEIWLTAPDTARWGLLAIDVAEVESALRS